MQRTPASRKKSYWIIVADESNAIIYTQELKHSPLEKLAEFENEVSRRKVGEILADRGGRAFDSHGQGRHTMAREKSGPKRQAAIAFGKLIAERTGKAIHNGTCRGFALIAAPRFLGILRDALATSVRMEPFAEIDKDVVAKDAAFIAKLLKER